VDVAGGGTVHALAGLWALAATMMLGPRLGRYNKKGQPAPMPAHNVPFALLGSFLLAAGWLALNILRAPAKLGLAATATALAGAGGAIAATVYMTWRTRRPDPTIVANGLLAGLVASSASAGLVGALGGFVIGMVAGVLVCFSINWFDRLHIDDPVGTVAVHGIAGLWGLIAYGLHGGHLGAQLLGCGMLVVWALGVAWVFFKLLDRVAPMRVAPENEIEGLDITELGVVGYPDIPSGA
jgi:Amt family ammonium transporter